MKNKTKKSFLQESQNLLMCSDNISDTNIMGDNGENGSTQVKMGQKPVQTSKQVKQVKMGENWFKKKLVKMDQNVSNRINNSKGDLPTKEDLQGHQDLFTESA